MKVPASKSLDAEMQLQGAAPPRVLRSGQIQLQGLLHLSSKS